MVCFDGEILVYNNILENIMPMLLINPISFLYTKYTHDSIFGENFTYFNMLIITSMLLSSSAVNNYELYEKIKKIYSIENNILCNVSRPLIITILIYGIWYICQYEKIFGLGLIALLLKFKIYIMMVDIDQHVYEYVNNPLDDRLQCTSANIYDVHKHFAHYYDDDLVFNIVLYKTAIYVHKICILKFWVFLGCLYAYYISPSTNILYLIIIVHSLYIMSVLKLHYLLNNNIHPKLNINIMISDIFFSNLTHK